MSCAKPHTLMPGGGQNRRAARAQAAALRWLVRIAAFLTAAVLVFLLGYILVMGIPNLRPELFAWEYNSENVSLTPALINTVLMTAFALLIATPLGIFAAIWLVEYAHRGSKLVKVVRVTTETLQGIPSIVYGFFGMIVMVPAVQAMVKSDFFKTVLRVKSGKGMSLFTASLLLGIMILPTIITVSKTSLDAVPESYYEGALALGATHERSIYRTVLPAAKSGITAGVILGIGRAIGEAMAVNMVAGNQAIIPTSIFSGVRTLTSNIVLEMGYAADLHREALIATSVVLFVFILIINVSFSILKRRTKDN